MKPQTSGKDSTRQQAWDWLTRLYSGNANNADRAAFEAWLAADKRHRQHYRAAETLWRDLMYAEALHQPAEAARPQPAQTPSWWRRWHFAAWPQWAAACAGLLLVAVIASWYSLNQGPAIERYQTAVGENRDITLPDGTQLTLGARGLLEVSFSGKARRARLVAGDAYFSVAANAQKPFIVEAGDARIKVLGTQFEVRRTADWVAVAVTQGQVAVAAAASAGSPVKRLNAGQQIKATTDGLGMVETFDIAHAAQWRSGRFTYQNERLSIILADLQRNYRPGITSLLDKDMDIRMTTSFDIAQVEQFLAALAASHPVAYQRTGDGGYLLYKTESD